MFKRKLVCQGDLGKTERVVSYLEAQDLGLNELQRAAVDLDQTLTSLQFHTS